MLKQYNVSEIHIDWFGLRSNSVNIGKILKRETKLKTKPKYRKLQFSMCLSPSVWRNYFIYNSTVLLVCPLRLNFFTLSWANISYDVEQATHKWIGNMNFEKHTSFYFIGKYEWTNAWVKAKAINRKEESILILSWFT